MSKTTKGRLSICLVVCLGLGLTLAISLFYAQILNTISLNTERKGHTATLLQDGRILVAGGENTNGILDSSEIFDPVTETMVPSALLGAARTGHSATLLSSGQVLIAGGSNGAPLSSTEIYDPVTNSFAPGPEMNRARAGHTMTVLNDFQILVVGGDAEGTAEIFDPATGIFTLLESPLNEVR